MRLLDSTRLFAVIFTIGYSTVFNSNAATLYVDNKLSVSSTETYSIAGRNGSGNNGRAFRTIQMALDNMMVGDVICIRGGIYQERTITIPYSKNGTSWNTGKFNMMTSYPGEWAIIDGQKNIVKQSGMSPYALGWSGSQPLKFWKFERIEIRNGATSDGTNAAGFFGNYGPFQFRYCVFRDNIVSYSGNNPGGIVGYVWQDCIVEYCYFYNNGASTSARNSAHINIFADYKSDEIAQNGFINKNAHTMGNRYRYNLFVSNSGPAVAIKYKNDTFLTGRNPSGGHGYNDNYKHRGDHISNNIFKNTLYYAIDGRQDFLQIHNNIFDSCYGAATIGEWGKPTIYKAAVYNNTIQGGGSQGLFFNHYQYYTFQERAIVQYVFNNILDNCGDDWNTCDLTLERDPKFTTAIIDSFRIDRNFIYRPAVNKYDAGGTYVFWLGYTSDATPRYTSSTFPKVFPNSKIYYAKADASNSPYSGTSGAAKYITRGAYKFSELENVGNAGKNIRHPYIDSMKIPSYIGATNPADPNNNKWVSEVLNLVNLSTNKVLPVPTDPATDPEPTNPTPVNNAPVVSLVSAGKNTSVISDSVVMVRWKAQDDAGVSVCSVYVSVNDSSYRLLTARKTALDSMNWSIPKGAVSLQFKVRAYDAYGKYGELFSLKYSVTKTTTNKLRIYGYTVDENRIYAVWGKYSSIPNFLRIAVVYRNDRFARSVSEAGNKLFYSELSRGSTILGGLSANQTYYISIFGEQSSGSWSERCDSIALLTNNRMATGGSTFVDTLYVPEDGSDSVRQNLYCVKGNGNGGVYGTVLALSKTVNGKRAVQITVPSSVVNDTNGFYAHFIRRTSKYNDTVRISRPVKRMNINSDNFVTVPGKKHPISITAIPVKSGLVDVINYLKSPVSSWTYNRARAQITQWRPVTMENSKNTYYEYGQIADSFFNPLQGRLFWVMSNESVKFDFSQAIVPAHYEDFTIPIKSGWTHFAMPLSVPVSLSKILDATSRVWTTAILDSLEIYRWRATTTGYSTQSIYLPGIRNVSPDSIILTGGPGTGYAVYNRSNTAKSVIIPGKLNERNTLAKTTVGEDQNEDGWSICLDARLKSGDSLPSAYFGYSPSKDPNYFQQAPSLDDVQLLFKDSTGASYGHRLINSISGSNISFDVALINSTDEKDTVIFEIGKVIGLPEGIRLTIRDSKYNGYYKGSDSVIIELQPEETVYLTIDGSASTAVQPGAITSLKAGISKIVQNRLNNEVRVEFYSPSSVSNITLSLYSLNGKSIVRKSLRSVNKQGFHSVDLSLTGHSISNGTYIIDLRMKQNGGAESHFRAPVLLVNKN